MFGLTKSVRRRAGALAIPLLACVAGAALYAADANPAASQAPQLFALRASSDPGLDPSSPEWAAAPSINVPLSAQRSAYASGGGSVTAVRAQALHYKERLYIRLSWRDTTLDDSTLRVDQFSDAAAVEFPASAATTVPSICMGQADAGVNIWQWRADSQTGHEDPSVRYPNIWVESYPSDDPEFYPARAVGNPYAAADGGAVQNLVSRAFGNIRPSPIQDVEGHGVYADGGWAVVFARPMSQSDPSLVNLHDTSVTDIAFAVWNGSEGDRNGQKSVSTFVTLVMVQGKDAGHTGTWLIAAAFFAALIATGIGVTMYAARGRR